MRAWQIKNFFFKPIFRHPIYVDTHQRDPKILQSRKDWCTKHLGRFSWMILIEEGLGSPTSPQGFRYTWNRSLFYFRRRKDAATFKLRWYNTTKE